MSQADALADLHTKVGTETHRSDWFEVSQERINQFAAATNDFQWIHVDEEKAAASSPFGGTVAHGFLTLSLVPYLAGNVNPDKPRYSGIKLSVNYGLNRVRFPNPVLAGARVRCRTELMSVEEVKGGLQLVNKMTIEIDGQKKTRLRRRDGLADVFLVNLN